MFCSLLDEVEVTNAVYDRQDDDIVLGCGVSLAVLKFMWFKNGIEIHSDEHRAIAEHKASNYSFSTVTVKEIGKINYIYYSYNIAVCDNVYEATITNLVALY